MSSIRSSLLVVALAVALLAVLAALLPDEGGYGWDGWVVDALADVIPISDADVHIEPFVTGVEITGTALVGALVLWLVLRRRFRAALFAVAGVAGAVLLGTALKAVVRRPAIEGPPDAYSFPSGSATWAMAALATAVLLLPAHRRLLLAGGGTVVFAFCALIAWEEWHYPSDIVAGWCLALAWVCGLFLLFRLSSGTQGRTDRPRGRPA
jgi:membrane-associated phospholipid phosphatase